MSTPNFPQNPGQGSSQQSSSQQPGQQRQAPQQQPGGNSASEYPTTPYPTTQLPPAPGTYGSNGQAAPPRGPQQPAAYAQRPAPRPAGATTLDKTNTYAFLAIIFGFLVPVAGIVFGHMGLSQIKKNGDAGRGLALTGLIVGYAYFAFFALFIIAYFVFLVVIFGTIGTAFSSIDSYSSY